MEEENSERHDGDGAGAAAGRASEDRYEWRQREREGKVTGTQGGEGHKKKREAAHGGRTSAMTKYGAARPAGRFFPALVWRSGV